MCRRQCRQSRGNHRAGDAFNGGFAVALSEGMGSSSRRFGCATAGISITRPGTAPSMPTRAEIDALRS